MENKKIFLIIILFLLAVLSIVKAFSASMAVNFLIDVFLIKAIPGFLLLILTIFFWFDKKWVKTPLIILLILFIAYSIIMAIGFFLISMFIPIPFFGFSFLTSIEMFLLTLNLVYPFISLILSITAFILISRVLKKKEPLNKKQDFPTR